MIKKLSYLFLLICFVFNCIATFAQSANYRFQRYSTENVIYKQGLSQNSVYSIEQDSDGFLWLGTWDGLNRFDGYEFKVFKSEDGIDNNTINVIHQDVYDNLWVGTQQGLYYKKHNSLSFIKVFTSNHDIGDVEIFCVFEEKNTLWFGTESGVLRVNITKKSVDLDYCYNYFIPIFDIERDIKGNLLIVTNSGLYAISGKSFVKPILLKDNINHFLIDDNNLIWIASDKGLFVYDSNYILNDILLDYDFSEFGKVFSLYKDSDGVIWFGSEKKGLCNYIQRTNHITGLEDFDNNEDDYFNDKILSIFEDKQGILWIGTYNGLIKVTKKSNIFQHYYKSTSNINTLSNSVVYAFWENQEATVMWIGTDNGISVYDKGHKQFSYFYHINGVNSLSGNRIRCIYEDSRADLWIGTYQSGLNKYDHITGEFTHYFGDKLVLSVLEDNNGLLWMACRDGLYYLDPYSGEIGLMISDVFVYELMMDNKNTIWCGTDNGIYYKEQYLLTFLHLPLTSGETEGINRNLISCFYETDDDIIWIATMGGGLCEFRRSNNSYLFLTTNEGLSNNVIYDIVEDDSSCLWLSTNYGLSRLDPSTYSFTNYSFMDGLQGNEFNLGAAFIDNEGLFYFGGMNGYNTFNPNNIISDSYHPVAKITSFNIFSVEYNKMINNNDTVFLNYDQNFFTILFSALDFSNPYKNKYKYKLDNVDENWIEVEASSRKASYTKLLPGAYKFQLLCTNSEGNWQDYPTTIYVIINPPWYSHWLFELALILLGILVVTLFVQYRLKTIRKKHNVERQVLEFENQMRTLERQALRLQMNPHFIFNSLNSIQSYVLDNNIDKAVNYLAKFSRLMRLILTNSDAAYVPINDEIEALTFYLEIEQLRFENKFNFVINMDDKIDLEFVEIPSMIIQPYIENAIIHGIMNKKTKGNISLSFYKMDNVIRCEIEDDGIGREKALELKKDSGINHKSKGMLITKRRLEILNQNMNNNYELEVIDLYDNDIASGTKIIVYIPFTEN